MKYDSIHLDLFWLCKVNLINFCYFLFEQMESETDNGATTNYKFNHDEIIRFDETKFNCTNDQIPQQIDEVSRKWRVLSECFQFDSIFYLLNFVDFIRFQFRIMSI